MQRALTSSAGLQGPLSTTVVRQMLRRTVFCVVRVIVPAMVAAWQDTAGLWKLQAQGRGWDMDRAGTGTLAARDAGGSRLSLEGGGTAVPVDQGHEL